MTSQPADLGPSLTYQSHQERVFAAVSLYVEYRTAAPVPRAHLDERQPKVLLQQSVAALENQNSTEMNSRRDLEITGILFKEAATTRVSLSS